MGSKIDSRSRDLESCALCIKYLMFAMNFVYFVAGCAMLGVCLWVYLERNFLSTIFGTVLLTVSIVMLIVLGSITIIISFCGCCGAIMENKVMVLVYFLTLMVLFLGMVVAGVIAVVFQAEIGEEIRGSMLSTLQNDYGVDLDDSYHRMITDAWDESQEFVQCCAVEEQSWGAYRTSEWYKEQPGVVEADKPLVPQSCCKQDQYGEYIDVEKCQTWMLGPPGRNAGERNEALHYRGCYYAGVDLAEEYSAIIIALGIGIGISVVAGMVFSIMLYINISRKH